MTGDPGGHHSPTPDPATGHDHTHAPAPAGAAAGARAPATLDEILAEARRAGFLGPGPVETHIRHAEGFVALSQALVSGSRLRLLDLGSGAGVPGLIVADRWPEASIVLLDANGRRTGFVRQAVERLNLGDRVEVIQIRAEEAGRDPRWRGGFDGVLARSFGRPAVVAECAAPLLKVGGWLVVSEPPAEDVEDAGGVQTSGGAPEAADKALRWPADGLRLLGLELADPADEGGAGSPGLEGLGFTFQALRQAQPCPEVFPRRNGVPAKKPLF